MIIFVHFVIVCSWRCGADVVLNPTKCDVAKEVKDSRLSLRVMAVMATCHQAVADPDSWC